MSKYNHTKSKIKSNNFDSIAFIYDWLGFLVFGKSLQSAQATFFDHIPNSAEVLILGGGTGHILNQLEMLNKSLNVYYVEASQKMISKAERRGPFKNLSIYYENVRHDQIEDRNYDVVITAFFLDVFESQKLPNEIQRIWNWVDRDGIWLFTDFVKTKVAWQKWLIQFMHFFFKLTTNLEGKELQDFHHHFEAQKLKVVVERRFFYGMIGSCVLKANQP